MKGLLEFKNIECVKFKPAKELYYKNMHVHDRALLLEYERFINLIPFI